MIEENQARDREVSMINGIFSIDSNAIFFISGDYPYYRDEPSSWSQKLDKMKEIGIRTVSCYFPWRHHAIKQEDGTIIHDFSGSTYPSRNVIKFIELVHEKGMYLIGKPGPFIHAETKYGGLPDFVNPKLNKSIVTSRNAWGYANKWPFMFGKPLPSPLEEPYLTLVKQYMHNVGKSIFKEYTYPDGPIVAIQILNEGIYSQGNISLDNYEYSPVGYKLFREFLEEKYDGNITRYNDLHGTKYENFSSIKIPKPSGIKKIKKHYDLLHIIDYGEFATRYYNLVMSSCINTLVEASGGKISRIPLLINMNPPANFKQGSDIFLTRVIPENLIANYGYTNWIGVVPYREDAFYKYLIMIKRNKGINLEENWGFSKYYDPLYAHGHVSYYQTLLALAFGTTGFNVYTAVNTSSWPKELDEADPPYPRTAPIDERGNETIKCDILELITRPFQASILGKKLVEANSPSNIFFGLYMPYASIHSWLGNKFRNWWKLGFKTRPSVAEHAWTGFHLSMEYLGHDYTPINIEDETSLVQLMKRERSTLVFISSAFLAKKIQNWIITFLENGKTAIIIGEVPHLDENLQECNVLRDFISQMDAKEHHFVNDDLDRRFSIEHHETSGKPKGKLLVVNGNPFERVLDKNERKFNTILSFLKSLLHFGHQIPDAHADSVIGNQFKWLDKPYPKNVLAFGKNIINYLSSNGQWLPILTYQDEKIKNETIEVKQVSVQSLPSRKYRVYVRRHENGADGSRTDFVFIFSRCDESLDVSFSISGNLKGDPLPISLNLPPRSAQLVVIEKGNIVGFIINSVIGFINHEEIVRFLVGNTQLTSNKPRDVAGFKDEKGNFQFFVANQGEETIQVTIGNEQYTITRK